MSPTITRIRICYSKMMRGNNRGRQCWLCQDSEHISDGKYVDGKVKEQEESEKEARNRKADSWESCFLNLEGEHKVLVKTILVLQSPTPCWIHACQHPSCSQPYELHTEHLTSYSQLFSHRASHSSTQAYLPKAGFLRSIILRMQCTTESSVKFVKHPDSWAQFSDILVG